MIVKKHILETLSNLDKYYNDSLCLNSKKSIYFSKLAVLEYCGWIEESFDDIARRSVKGKIKTEAFQKILDGVVIGKNSGFQYVENLRPMMLQAMGLQGMEKLENYLRNSGTFEIFVSELSMINKYRKTAAHTWVKGVIANYPAPSIIRDSFIKIYPIIKGLYSEVVKL
jgi:hypothetical protein